MVETKVNTIFWVFLKVTCDEVSKNPFTQSTISLALQK
jgi:hypothetical protein